MPLGEELENLWNYPLSGLNDYFNTDYIRQVQVMITEKFNENMK